ncbi:MAG TPA: hypothetical protein PLJ69_01605 [Methanothrix sp.]|jgi:tetratricopeptide (TPR) repeat protein|nr:hypothetical protein [Methanothrix sp.]OPY56507.1 MAG: Tetratricopeptide repeat protein [Methanosaeta sp. PtaU1.Bin055]HPY71621.1 hypothetical protein [Methanothrix sp.]HQA61622.1 hypothetical protein [Methanothrix sp.]
MAIEMSSPWMVGPVFAVAGAALAWIATEYRTRKTYRGILLLLAKCADDFAGVGQVEKALSIYDQILKGVPRLEPAVRGEIRFREGLSRYASSFEGAREENLALAVEAFEEAIRLFKVEADPIEHAQAQNGLGISLVRLSEIEGDGVPDPSGRKGGAEEMAKNLNRAILAFEAALKIYAAEGRGQEEAQTENNIGDAYLLLSQIGGPKAAEALDKAIEAYEAALKFRTAEAHPEDRAETQTSLGRAWMALAQLAEGDLREGHLDRAISSFKAALEIRTKEDHPQERAETQTLFGMALVLEAEPQAAEGEIRWSDREGLKKAIEAYEDALAVRTQEARPLEFAETKNLLGEALVILAGAANGPADGANLKRAIRAFEEALEVRTQDFDPEGYAEIQNNLGVAYRKLSKLEDREGNLERSILAYEAALRARAAGARRWGEKGGGGEDSGAEKSGDEALPS